MELLELILFLLIAVVASSLLDQVLRGVSLPLVQILLGVIIALCPALIMSAGHSAMITSSMIERVSSLLRIWGLEEAMSFRPL